MKKLFYKYWENSSVSADFIGFSETKSYGIAVDD